MSESKQQLPGDQDAPVPDGGIGKKAVSAVRAVVAGRFAYQILTIGFTVVLARVLTPEDYGVYGIAFLSLQFLIYIEGFRIESALIQRPDLTVEEGRQGYALLLGFGFLFSCIMIGVAVPVSTLFNEPDAVGLIRVLSLTFILRAAASIQRVYLRRELRFGALAAIEISGLIPGGIAAVWMGVNGYGPYALATFYLVQAAFASIVAIGIVGIRLPMRPLSGLTNNVFRFGIPASGSEVIGYLWFHAPSIVVGWGVGTEALGFFRQAMGLVSKPVMYLQEVTNQLAFPVLARAHERGYAVKGSYLHAYHTVCLVGIPICVFTILLAPDLVRILYGSQWDAIVPIVRILVPVAFAKVVHPFAAGLFQARGRPSVDLKINAGLLVVLLGLLAAGLQFGTIGIAVGTTLSFGLLAVVAQVVANKWLDVSLLEIVSTMLTGFGASLVAGGVAYSLRMLVVAEDSFLLGAAVASLAGVGIYLGVLYLIDRTSLQDLLQVLLPFSRGSQL